MNQSRVEKKSFRRKGRTTFLDVVCVTGFRFPSLELPVRNGGRHVVLEDLFDCFGFYPDANWNDDCILSAEDLSCIKPLS